MAWGLLDPALLNARSRLTFATVSGLQASSLPFSAGSLPTPLNGGHSIWCPTQVAFGPFWNCFRTRLCARAQSSSEYAAGEPSLSCPDKPRGGLPRFHVDVLPTSQGMVAQLEGDEFWHMTKVLRLGVNDRLELFDGRGGIVMGKVVRIDRNVVHVAIKESARILSPSGPSWHVAAAFGSLKGGRGDWLVEKCTELGATTLTPLLTHRSIASGDRSERFQRLIVAATKQCQRLHAMELRKPTEFQSFLPQVVSAKVALLAIAEATPMVKVLSGLQKNSQGGILLIGPEGDFTDEEVKLLLDAGALQVGLGPRRLRVETAAVAMLATAVLMGENTAL
ncbi:hypothetical protein O6H91_01G083600 [Diphasiastrum complanatum]|uniref:Uncharacterized protein n=1 Tax=Diphasiastrum complanatum TaxID=34168 RepID=A0ACC2ESW1_DIPCM|nr:hypothetical protein O6H91_01G083600 [Diphasiastrum complanatum]